MHDFTLLRATNFAPQPRWNQVFKVARALHELIKISHYWKLNIDCSNFSAQLQCWTLVDWQLVTGTPSFYLCSMWLLEISKEYVKPANEHSISCFPATFSVSILLGRNRLVHSVLSLSPRRCSVSRLNRPATYKQRTIGTRLETTALNTSFPISVCSRALWNRTELPW